MIDFNILAAACPVAAVLTPLAMHAWKKLFPAQTPREFARTDRSELRRRNDWIDRLASTLMVLGAAAAVLPWMAGVPFDDPLAPSLGFGLMLWLPALFILAATLPLGGAARFREFLHWYELKWGIGARSISAVYMPFYALGLIGLGYAAFRLLA